MEEKKHQESGEHNPPPRQGFEKPLIMLEPSIDGSDRKSVSGRQSPHLINEIQVNYDSRSLLDGRWKYSYHLNVLFRLARKW